MKAIAVILILLCIAAVIGIGYLYVTSNLIISGTGCVATDAMDQQETFAALKNAVDSESFTGTLYQTHDWKEPSEYQFYTYTLRLRNNTFLPAKAIEIQIAPMDGDVLLFSDLSRHDLARHSTGDYQATLLTAKAMHNIREITVTWYFWGLPFSARTTYSH